MIRSHIASVHQIEITSRCNLRCKYCVHPKMKREKMDMSWDIFKKSIQWAKTCIQKGTQIELNLAGIGESLMHPDFLDMCLYARMEVGHSAFILLASNGLLMTESIAKELSMLGIKVAVSTHRPEKAGPAIEICKHYDILMGVSNDPATAAIDWAGQVNWFVSAPKRQCFWVSGGRCFIASNGDVLTCCLDGDGLSKCGNVMVDDMHSIVLQDYQLCSTCDQEIPKLSVLNGGLLNAGS